jgi:propanediol dehydratase small subunit
MPYKVWVGGIDDDYQIKEEAEEAVEEWEKKGYDDVILEEIEDNEIDMDSFGDKIR